MAAAIVLFVIGLLHSVLAEIMLFRDLPKAQGLPPLGFPPLLGRPDSPAPTIRACWHLLTVFGWTMALIIGRISALPELAAGDRMTVKTIAVSVGGCAVIMFVGTRAKHLGWVGFLLAGALCWLGVA